MRHQRIDGDLAQEVARLVAGLHAEARRVSLPALQVPRDAHRSPGGRRRRRAARATWRVGKSLARRSYARRRPLAPIATALSLYIAGVIFAVSPHGANTVPLFAVLVALVVWWRSRRRGWREAEKCYAAAVYVGAMGWLETAAIIGAGPPMPGVLGFAALAAAVPWWWHHRVRPHVPEYDDRIEIWDARVGVQGGALPGSRLLDVAEVSTGWSAMIALPGGKLTTENALGATKRIASAYRKPATSVIVEPLMTAEEDRARLLVLSQNPFQQVLPFTGPQLDHTTGRFPVGPYADGTSATWKLWTPGSGACHGLVAGTTGCGKSGFVNQLCTETRLSGVSVLWLADPQRGESVPDWQDLADPSFWFAGTIPEIRRMLQAAERIMDDRQKRRSRERWTDELGRPRRGRGKFDPTFEVPLLDIVIDEAPAVLLDPECRRIIALIVKQGRKLGVAVTVITQVPSLAELGNDLSIRSMLASTNILMFRTSDKYSKNMGMPSDLPVNPSNLPEEWPDGSTTAGLGYLASASGRVSPLRAMKVEDPYGWATVEAHVAKLEPPAIEAASEDFQTWRKRRDDDSDEDDAVPSAAPAADEQTVAATALTPAARRSTARDAILAHLKHCGQIHTGVLAAELGVPLPTASSTLRRLERDGHVIQVRHGIWAHVDHPFEEIDDEADVA